MIFHWKNKRSSEIGDSRSGSGNIQDKPGAIYFVRKHGQDHYP